MKGLNLLRILLIIPLLALATAAPALAKAPDIAVDSWDDYWTWSQEDNPCGFDILVHDYGTLRTQFFYDQDGKLIKVHEIYGALKHTISANNKTLNALRQGPILYDVISETEVIATIVGTDVFYPIPGYGPSVGDVGNTILRYELEGEEWIITEVIKDVGTPYFEDVEAVCGYLGP